MTEKCKNEIKEYLISKGYGSEYLETFSKKNVIIVNGVTLSRVGQEKNLDKLYLEDDHKICKYLLELIGHILRKHKLISVVCGGCGGNYICNSINWRFKNILNC